MAEGHRNGGHMKRIQLAAAVLGLAALTACGTAQGSVSPDAGSPAPDAGGDAPVVSAPRTGVLNYKNFESPEALAAEEPVVVTGTVEEFAAGRSVLSWNSDAGYHDMAERTAVLAVEVDEVFKGEEQVFEGHVYVRVSRGIEALKEDGEPDRPSEDQSTITSVDALNEAVPAGTRVALMVGPAGTEPHEGDEWVDAHRGYPEGAALMWAHPQGMVFENGRGGSVFPGLSESYDETAGWAGLGAFSELEQRLADHFSD